MFLGKLPGEYRLRITRHYGHPIKNEAKFDMLANNIAEALHLEDLSEGGFSSKNGICYLDITDQDYDLVVDALKKNGIQAELHREDQSEMVYMPPYLYVRFQDVDDEEAEKLWEAHSENYLRMINSKAPDNVKRFLDEMPCLHDAELVIVEVTAGRYNIKVRPELVSSEYSIVLVAAMHQSRLVLPPAIVSEDNLIKYDEFHLSDEGKSLSWHFFCGNGYEHSFYEIKEILWKKEKES